MLKQFPRIVHVIDTFIEGCSINSGDPVNEWLPFWSPKTLAEELRKHIVGQEQGIKDACLLLYNHCERIANPQIKRESCALFFGRPGTGKTELFRKLAPLSPRESPICILDCTMITPAGYKGESIGEMLASNLESEISNTYRPLIVLDEFDKIFQDSDDDSGFMQEKTSSLLKAIEGHKITVQTDRSKTITIDTSLCAFAMVGHCKEVLDHWSRKKMKTIGFGRAASAEVCNPGERTYAETFREYGRIPREVLRRIGSYTLLHTLSKEQILQALLLEEGYVNEALKKARREGIRVSFSNDFCEGLAATAAKYQLAISEIGPALLKAVDYHIYYEDGEESSIHLEDIRKYLFIEEGDRKYE